MACRIEGKDLGFVYEVKFADFSSATGGDREVVAAVTDRRIVVLSYTVSATVDGTITWKSATTALSGAIQLLAAGTNAYCTGYHPHGLLQTEAGEALNITPAGPTAAGYITYVEVP